MIDVAFVVDSSFKTRGQSAWTQLLAFVNAVIDWLAISQFSLRVSFVSYGDSARIEFRFQQYSDSRSLKQRIAGIGYHNSGGNNLASALDTVRTQVFQTNAGARQGAPWVAVVVTDRSPSIRTQDTATAAGQARAAGIQIIPVGMTGTGRLTQSILTQIAFVNSRVFSSTSYSAMTASAPNVAAAICDSHLSESLNT